MIQSDDPWLEKGSNGKQEKTHNEKQRETLFFFIFLLAGLLLIFLGIGTVKQAFASRNWPSCSGKILSSSVEKTSSGVGKNRSSSYTAAVLYEYRVAGQRYTSNQIFFGQYNFGSRSPAQALAAKYPAGKRVLVYYEPQNPANAVLQPGVSWASFAVLGFGIIFSAVGAGGLYWAIKHRSG